MARYYKEDDIVVTENSGVASNLIWAVTTLAIVIILVYTIFFSGLLTKSNPVKKIVVDVNVAAPSNR